MSDALVTHKGGCHCRRVSWEVEAPALLQTHTCNCSICTPYNYQHLIVPKSRFTLLTGESDLSCYNFGSGIAQHFFCGHCGVKSFYVPRSNPNGVSINVRCIDSQTITGIEDRAFDGQNWEQNAGALAGLDRA